MAKKNYVLDTNILIHDPDSIKKFEDNDVYIPSHVIEELDKFKTEKNERGYCARQAIKNISRLKETGNLLTGVKLEGGGKLHVLYIQDDDISLPKGFSRDKIDNLILLDVKALSQKNKSIKTILVTNDTNMQIKADIFGIPSQEFKNDRVSLDQELYDGRSVRHVDDKFFDDFFTLTNNGIDVEPPDTEEMKGLITNEFVNLVTWQGNSILVQYDGIKFNKLFYSERTPHPCGLSTRNTGQTFTMEACLSNKPLTIIKAPAGTGKTLLALGCGLHQVMKENRYKRVLIYRANVTMDEDIGALPGDEMKKIDPLLRGTYDNLEILFAKSDDTPQQVESKKENLFNKGIIQAESLAYLRGRSITKTYIIVDEAQNTTPNQMKSILTRIGEYSKVVIMGDINQIDSPRLDSRNNGLVYALEKMKGSPLCEIVSMYESECTRSELAKEASDRMNK